MKKTYLAILAAVLFNTANSQNIEDDLFAHWQFNSSLLDTTANARNLILQSGTGSTYVAGREAIANTALNCTGDDVFSAGTYQIDSGNNDWSIAVWIKPTAITGYVVGNKNLKIFPNFSNFENQGQFALAVLGDGRIMFQVVDGTTLNPVNLIPDSLITFNEWNHIVCNYNHVADSIFIFKNGLQIFSKLAVSLQQTSSILCVGGYQQTDLQTGGAETISYSDKFTGSIDDIRIYNRALSATHIQELFVLTTPVSTVLNELDTERNVNIYPNPLSDNFIEFTSNKVIKSITVLSMLGQKLIEKEIHDIIGSVDLTNISAGSYLLLIQTANGVETKRFEKL